MSSLAAAGAIDYKPLVQDDRIPPPLPNLTFLI